MPSRSDQITMTDEELQAFLEDQKVVSVRHDRPAAAGRI